MAGRGRRGPPNRRPRGPPRQDYQYQDAELIESAELELEGKKITIELKKNDQGKFVKILETQMRVHGKIIMSSNKAFELRSHLNEFVAEYDRLEPAGDTVESERIKTEVFTQGRRRYYIDLRQNQRGRFLKITMLAGNKTFVAIPGEHLSEFRDTLVDVLKDCTEGEESGGAMGRDRPPPLPRSREPREPREPKEPKEPRSPVHEILPSKEVRAGGKRFYFDVEQNDRGTFIKLSEVLTTGRRNRINIPQSCWSKMRDTFASYAKDLPYEMEEGSTGSGSEDN